MKITTCPRCRATLPPLADLLALNCDRCNLQITVTVHSDQPLPGFEQLTGEHPRLPGLDLMPRRPLEE